MNYKKIYESLNKEQKKLAKELSEKDIFYSKNSIQSAINGLSKEEKRLYESVLAKRKQTINSRAMVMYNVLSLDDTPENQKRLNLYKDLSFEDAQSNIVWHALNYKAEYDTSLSFMDLYGSGYMSLEDAWNNFLKKSNEEIQKNIENKEPVFASFKTFSENYVRNAIVVEIMKQKSIDETKVDVGKSAAYKFKQINQAIQSYICMNGKIPSDEIIASLTGYSIKVIQNARFTMNEGTFNEKGNYESTQIIKDFDFSNTMGEDSQLRYRISEDSKTYFWRKIESTYGERNYKILYSYFYQGKNYQEIGDDLGLSRERIRQLLNDMYSNIKNNPDLLEMLYNSVE